ncbi:hypothetical protein Tco_0379075, partial [Tanacetum coccineum]
LQAEFDEDERLAREKDEANVALTEEWNDIQAKIDRRRKHFTAKRTEEKRNRPPTRAQQRSIMCTYLKNMEGWKPKSLKSKSFANIQDLFDKAFKRVNTFVDYRTELVEESSKKAKVMEESSKKAESEIAQESSSKRAGEALEQESSKKQKLEEDKEVEELKQCLEIVPYDGDDATIDSTPLSIKYPTIVDYKIYKEGKKSFIQIIRADGNSQMYLTFGKMLKNFNREDLEVLWSIVKAIFKKTEPVNYMDNFLILNLKTMFEHHVEDNVQKNLQGLVKVLNWKLYDSCGVHCVTMHNILYYLLVEKMYPLTNHTLHQMFNDVKLQAYYECEMAFELLRLVKKQLKEGYGRNVGIKSLFEVTTTQLMLLVQKLLLLVLKVNDAGIKVTTAERLQLLEEFMLTEMRSKTYQRKNKDFLNIKGESLNKQDVKTSLFWEFGRFTSRDGESIESYYSRFYKMMYEMVRNQLEVATMQVNVEFLQQLQPEWSRFVTIVKQTQDLDTVSYHKLFDILKKILKEVNEIRAKKIAKNANPLALFAAAQQYLDTYYQAPKPHRSYASPAKTSPSTRSHATTRHKGKEIAKPITPLSESATEEDMTVAGAKEIIGSQVVQQTRIQCFNYKEFRHFAKECRKPKRAKDYTYHKEKMLLCKQAEKGVPLQVEQADWLEDTDEEIDEQHSEQPESINDTHVVEKDNSNVIPDSSNMCDNDNQTDQNAEECDDERVVLANLIANLKLDTDENKKIQKQLKKANTSLSHDLQDCKSALEECKSSLEKSNRTRDRYLGALHDKKVELEKYKIFKDHTIEKDTLERKLNETLGLLTQKELDIKEGLKIKAYEVSVVKEKHDELVKQSLLTKSCYEGLVNEKNKVIKDLKLKEEKDLDKLIAVEKQLKFINEIVYKRNLTIKTIHMLAPKGSTYNGRPTFANPMYLKKAQSEKPCYYEIPYDKCDLANLFAPDRERALTLEQKSRSKLNKDLVKPYDYTKQNSLYEIFKPP